jgi:glycosyltransferase involved in cell wall biosynthesis
MISVTILVKNSQDTLEKTLASLKDFPEVIVVDTGSTDLTLEIAKKFPNVRIFNRTFKGFGPSHNEASNLASHEWILSIDSDEVLSSELSEEILSLKLDPHCVYSLSRHNYFNGKHIKWGGGWYPDPVIRLYHRQTTQFTDDAVHEKVISKGLTLVSLKGALYHTPYRQISDFLTKMQTYSSLFAEEKSARPPSILKAIFHAWFAFFKSYVLKRGFLGGKEGFIISAYNSHTTFYKYLKLAEKIKQQLLQRFH